MATTLDSPDSNLLDANPVNWRWVVYPILAVLILLFGGCGIYFYLQNERAEHEAAARQALLEASTPDALLQVADQFPGTTHAAMALIAAGNMSYEQKDYASAQKDYQRVSDLPDLDASVHDSARLGLASALEAANSDNQAIDTYLSVAQRGKSSPYSPYAYMAAAHIYERQHNTDKEKLYLIQAASIDSASPFSQQAQKLLQTLNGASSDTPTLPSTP